MNNKKIINFHIKKAVNLVTIGSLMSLSNLNQILEK